MKIVRYTSVDKSRWDLFVNESKNATFLHLRDYMDYHSDRFADFSLMCIDDNDNIIAVLPANRIDNTLYSHQGLTYGGWIMPIKGFSATTMLEMWQAMTEFLALQGIERLIYKAIPHIYHRYPAEEDIYAIFRANGAFYSSLISTTLPLDNSRLRFNENARRSMKSALNNGVIVEQSDDFETYWNVLSQMLKEQYNTSPVHSLEEIKLLQSRFPKNIKLYVAKHNEEVVAGSVIFFTHTVAHAQYIAASAEGRSVGALDGLFCHLITEVFAGKKFFDFGISTEQGGRYLNEGLAFQKEGFGARAVVYDTYKLKIN